MNRPYNAEGFPLPTIKEWNALVTQVVEAIEKNYISDTERLEALKKSGKIKDWVDTPKPVLQGAVDDLVSALCPRCGKEMIRQLYRETRQFNVGIVYCDAGQHLKDRPQEYWVEIWPNADIGPDKTMQSGKQRIANIYRFSNPVIPRCFNGTDIWLHRHIGLSGAPGDYGLTYFEGERTKTLPEPEYAHK